MGMICSRNSKEADKAAAGQKSDHYGIRGPWKGVQICLKRKNDKRQELIYIFKRSPCLMCGKQIRDSPSGSREVSQGVTLVSWVRWWFGSVLARKRERKEMNF